MKGFIYRIYDNTTGDIYYGSTIQSVAKRMAGHRQSYKQYLKGIGNYSKAYEILKNNDYDYSIIEELEYEDKYDLFNRERFYIENNDCVNKCIPNRTNKEYYQDNKERRKEYQQVNREKIAEKKKLYYEANKEEIVEKQKLYNKAHKDKIVEYKKEYYQGHKEELAEKRKEYNKVNKDKIDEQKKAYNKEKVLCEICLKEL